MHETFPLGDALNGSLLWNVRVRCLAGVTHGHLVIGKSIIKLGYLPSGGNSGPSVRQDEPDPRWGSLGVPFGEVEKRHGFIHIHPHMYYSFNGEKDVNIGRW